MAFLAISKRFFVAEKTPIDVDGPPFDILLRMVIPFFLFARLVAFGTKTSCGREEQEHADCHRQFAVNDGSSYHT